VFARILEVDAHAAVERLAGLRPFVAVTLLVVTVALLATVVPLWRAVRVEPIEGLREHPWVPPRNGWMSLPNVGE